MVTLVLQCVVAILTTIFGVASLRVGAGARNTSESHAASWHLTGCVFSILGLSTVIQLCIGAPWAFFSGPGTPVYETYLRLSPVGNHSRGVLVVAYGIMMIGLVRLSQKSRARQTVLYVVVSLVAMTVGGVLGWLEGPFERATHWTATAISDSIELIMLMVALLSALVWNTTDRLLWVSIVIFTGHELLDVGLYSALAWGGVPGVWRPHPMYIHLYASIAYLLMIVFAFRRLRLARRGVTVPGLLEPPAQATSSLLA